MGEISIEKFHDNLCILVAQDIERNTSTVPFPNSHFPNGYMNVNIKKTNFMPWPSEESENSLSGIRIHKPKIMKWARMTS